MEVNDCVWDTRARTQREKYDAPDVQNETTNHDCDRELSGAVTEEA